MTDLAPNPYRSAAWVVLLGGLGSALVFGQACEDGVIPDDDDTPRLDSDDDDAGADDDDAGPDDDDVVVPEGIPIGGGIAYQPTDGVVPSGDVRGGLFSVVVGKGSVVFGDERISDLIATEKAGLGTGQATFTNYVPDVLETAELTPIPGADGVLSAMFAPFAYVDGNGSGGFNGGDILIGGADDWILYVEAADKDDIPLELLGAGPGWNLVRDVGPNAEIIHIPEGVNSSQGIAMRVKLLPVTGGDVPVTAAIAFPDGSQVAAWHGTLSGLLEGTPPANPVLFVTPAVNGLRDPLIDWSVTGTPPNDHVGALPPGLLSETVLVEGLTGALYSQVGWVDDGDALYDAGALCDLLIAEGDKTLAWIASPGQDLGLAYSLGVTLE